MYEQRKDLYAKLAKERNSTLITYVIGDRPNLEAKIGSDAISFFEDLLDHYEGSKRISLFLYTRGGNTLAAWSLVKLLREFCDELEIIIPSKCHSAGTLICLGADQIVMTKQATLGPIDPSINSPLNPAIPGAPETARFPLSVEEVAGFIELAKAEGDMKSEDSLAQVFMKLADHVHPIALGQVKRARGQIQDLARKLLLLHMDDQDKIDKIIRVLCTEAGSHDYMIYRSEARKELGLNVETPSMALYMLIKEIYKDIRAELQLDNPLNPSIGLVANQPSDFSHTRVVIETQGNGGYHFMKRGTYTKLNMPNGQEAIQETVTADGWEPIT